ncbi:hypothetical protein CCHR01_11712 [Colletotrichum chrysophilum]|uniref:Uncharacterized protein n=1 Tax=Colletotrichum chrysophilum TaxID=1836956 RepID=A0AAD9AFF3_9PEZI|nr:hypothetical protein CCHR01_11712 [Colletotrichum chrysophilum]
MSAARWYPKRPSEHDLSLRPSDFQRDQTNVAAPRGGSGAQGHSAGIQASSRAKEGGSERFRGFGELVTEGIGGLLGQMRVVDGG